MTRLARRARRAVALRVMASGGTVAALVAIVEAGRKWN